jgi:hypothetical protein
MSFLTRDAPAREAWAGARVTAARGGTAVS